MTNKNVIIAAALAIIFDIIACLGDSNAVVYNLFMGLSCAAFVIYVAGLIRAGYSKENTAKTVEKESKASVRTAYAAE